MEIIKNDHNNQLNLTEQLTFQEYLNNILRKVFIDLNFDQKLAQILISSRPDLGQFQCNSAMILAKKHQTLPIRIAELIVKKLSVYKIFEEVSIITPGFINIRLNDSFLAEWTNQMLNNPRLHVPKVKISRKIFIDFGGPNIAKPLHIGHLRSALIGDCLQRVYRFCGDNVVSDIHLGDWGTQMGMLIEEIKKMYPTLPYFNEKFNGKFPQNFPINIDEFSKIYPKASLNCKQNSTAMRKARLATFELQQGRRGYRKLWKKFVNISITELKKDYSNLNIYFDLWKGESDVQPIIKSMIKNLIESGIAQKSQGATIIPITTNNINKKIPPLILLKSDGAVMYSTTDLATILERVQKYHAEKIIYVVDKRQSLYFKQVFSAAQKSNIAKNVELIHIGFGTVNGKDGKPFKTRDGDVMRLSTVIEYAKQSASIKNLTSISAEKRESTINKIALATVKFADLSHLYSSDYIFNLDKFSKFEGKTGPYILYSAVRIKSILSYINYKNSYKIIPAINYSERNLQLILARLSQTIFTTYENCQPNILCEYAYNVAAKFNQFYATSPVVNEINLDIQRSRIALCKLTLKVLEQVLDLLGILIPENM